MSNLTTFTILGASALIMFPAATNGAQKILIKILLFLMQRRNDEGNAIYSHAASGGRWMGNPDRPFRYGR